MITKASGNLLRADAEALVNTVNTVGVMGKGIALQFKKAYPAMYADYRRRAQAGEVRLGHVQVWPTEQMSGPAYIINFPTKGHWKSNSRLIDIESGLTDLVETVHRLGIRSIAVPPLGCGHGGLDWSVVEPRIRAAFEQIPDVEVFLFAPDGAPTAADMIASAKRPVMNVNRAALVKVLDCYTKQALAPPRLIETQKLLYFLQIAGQPLRLDFQAHHYGPYADNLRHVLTHLEGHFLSGYGDGSAAVSEAEPLTVFSDAAEAAEAMLREDPDTNMRIERVLGLTEGFDSAYGLELLATVHWVALHEHPVDDTDLVAKVRGWSHRKAGMFTADHIHAALAALRDRRWLTSPVPA